MNNFKLHFINHTSFLIEHNEWLLLLDPWPSSALSFDGWISNPPCFMNEELLVAFINNYSSMNNKNFGIIISIEVGDKHWSSDMPVKVIF